LNAGLAAEVATIEEPARRAHGPAPARSKTPTARPGELGGRTFGSFTLRQCIGEGGFGAVYAATQAGIDREAVVKVLHPHHQRSSSMTERFLREAKLASSLDHPYAAHVYAYGAEPDGYMWIAMELVHGTLSIACCGRTGLCHWTSSCRCSTGSARSSTPLTSRESFTAI
jgi:serine/threonine-protein kinase